MPLKEGKTDKIVKANIAELIRSGTPRQQAIAIALGKARGRRKRKRKQVRGRRKNKCR